MLKDVEVEIYAGSAEDVIIPLTDGDDAPIADLSGWTGSCQVRYSATHPAVLAEWSTANASLVLADSSARLVVSKEMAEAALSWPWRLGRFDLRLVAPEEQGSLPNRPIRGIIRVVPGITR
jgi:hypothetical protein